MLSGEKMMIAFTFRPDLHSGNKTNRRLTITQTDTSTRISRLVLRELYSAVE